MTNLLWNEEVLRVMEERNIPQTIKRRKELSSKIRYFRTDRGKMGRRGRRHKQLLHDLKGNTG
jgi:hypothetical protein